MNIDFMRKLDDRLGGLFIDIIRALSFFKFRGNPHAPSKAKDILFIKFFGAGSLILATPMLRGLKSLYDNPTIHLLTFRENFDLCVHLPLIDHILTIRNNSFSAFASDVAKALFQLWKIRPSIVVDGEFFSNFTCLFAWLCPTKIRVGFHERQVPRGDVLTHPVALNTHKHIARNFYSLAMVLGAKYENADLDRLVLRLPDERDMKTAFAKMRLDPGSPLIVLNPNAGPLCLLRRWPAGHFRELVLEMARKYPENTFLFIGSKSEASYVGSITGEIDLPNVINSAGLLSITELCALIFKAALVITNDSMPLHIASAYGKPLVCFFGPETPRFYGPPHQNALVFFDDIPCSPCLDTFDNKVGMDCKDNICLRQITPERVMREIEKRFLGKERDFFNKDSGISAR